MIVCHACKQEFEGSKNQQSKFSIGMRVFCCQKCVRNGWDEQHKRYTERNVDRNKYQKAT